MSKTQQTNSEIHEDQLLNFLVNPPGEEVALALGESAELDAEDIYEILVDACTDGTSVSTLCERSEDVPHENPVLYHFRTKFDLGTLEQVGNMLLQKDVLGVLPQQARACADLHLRPYYDDENDTDGLYYSQVKRGTATFHVYVILYTCVKNEHYMLVARRLEHGDAASSVLAEFLGTLDGLDLGVKAVCLNHEFYDSKCLTLLQAYDRAYVIPTVRWGRTIKRELSEGWSRVIQHSLTTRLDGYSWAVEPPIYIDCTYQNGRYDEHGVTRHGYVADAPFTNLPRDARYHYAKRFGTEVSYRLSEQSIMTTSTQNPVVRLLHVVASLLSQNVWWYLHWECAATPRRGGRRLWERSFKEFINMVHRAAWTASVVRRATPASRPPDNRFHR